jgi:4-diphosphocytidyl-2-C-methyl-D-erythritol kinase
VTEPSPRRVEIAAPAKLNLGLEIVGKRADGYHDLATVFLTVNLCDRLVLSGDGETARRQVEESRSRDVEEWARGVHGAPLPSQFDKGRSGGGRGAFPHPSPSPIAMGEGLVPAGNRLGDREDAELGSTSPNEPSQSERGRGEGLPRVDGAQESTITFTCSDPTLATEDNLALRALHALSAATGDHGTAHLSLEKRIPTAAGLGGASSDAAAALLAGNAVWNLGLPHDRLREIAASLGSDVPFLLRGGCAVGRGRGDLLDPLPLPRDVWFVLVMPRLVIPRKTARLYALLASGDFGDGSRVFAQAERLRVGLPLDPALLGNAFARPLASLIPELANLPDLLRAAGAPSVALSGAGPAHYVPLFDSEEAERVAAAIRRRLGSQADVVVAEPVPARALTS